MGMRIYLAKTAHHQLIPNIYHKSEKGKPYKMDLPLLKKRYHTDLKALIFTFPLQIHEIRVKCKYVGVIPRSETGQIRAISITYLTLTNFCARGKIFQCKSPINLVDK